MPVLSTCIVALLQLGMLLLFAVMAYRPPAKHHFILFAAFCFVFLLDAIITTHLRLAVFNSLNWNWFGKAGSALWAVAFMPLPSINSGRFISACSGLC